MVPTKQHDGADFRDPMLPIGRDRAPWIYSGNAVVLLSNPQNGNTPNKVDKTTDMV